MLSTNATQSYQGSEAFSGRSLGVRGPAPYERARSTALDMLPAALCQGPERRSPVTRRAAFGRPFHFPHP